MKLENIQNRLQSSFVLLQFFHLSILCYTTVLFISDVQHYIPIKLCKTSGSPHLFKIKGTLKSEDKRLNKNYLWDTLEINWDKMKLLLNSNEIELPQIIMIKMQDK